MLNLKITVEKTKKKNYDEMNYIKKNEMKWYISKFKMIVLD